MQVVLDQIQKLEVLEVLETCLQLLELALIMLVVEEDLVVPIREEQEVLED